MVSFGEKDKIKKAGNLNWRRSYVITTVPKDTYCLTLIHKNDLEIDYNHDTGLKLGNLIVVLN